MDKISIHWKAKALARYKKIALWYQKKMGNLAAEKFINGINDAVNLLSSNPYMGILEPELQTSKRTYRSFVEHKNHKIVYYIEKKTIYIADIWLNSQNPNDISKRLR